MATCERRISLSIGTATTCSSWTCLESQVPQTLSKKAVSNTALLFRVLCLLHVRLVPRAPNYLALQLLVIMSQVKTAGPSSSHHRTSVGKPYSYTSCCSWNTSKCASPLIGGLAHCFDLLSPALVARLFDLADDILGHFHCHLIPHGKAEVVPGMAEFCATGRCICHSYELLVLLHLLEKVQQRTKLFWVELAELQTHVIPLSHGILEASLNDGLKRLGLEDWVVQFARLDSSIQDQVPILHSISIGGRATVSSILHKYGTHHCRFQDLWEEWFHLPFELIYATLCDRSSVRVSMSDHKNIPGSYLSSGLIIVCKASQK